MLIKLLLTFVDIFEKVTLERMNFAFSKLCFTNLFKHSYAFFSLRRDIKIDINGDVVANSRIGFVLVKSLIRIALI